MWNQNKKKISLQKKKLATSLIVIGKTRMKITAFLVADTKGTKSCRTQGDFCLSYFHETCGLNKGHEWHEGSFKADLRPARPGRADLRYDKTDLRSEKADLRFGRAGQELRGLILCLRSLISDLERANLSPERLGRANLGFKNQFKA